MYDVSFKKNTKMFVFAKTLMSVTNTFLKMDMYPYQDLKSGGKIKEKTQRVSWKLTVFHISWVSVECLVDNARFEERPFGSVENQSVYKEEQSQGLIEGQRAKMPKDG